MLLKRFNVNAIHDTSLEQSIHDTLAFYPTKMDRSLQSPFLSSFFSGTSTHLHLNRLSPPFYKGLSLLIHVTETLSFVVPSIVPWLVSGHTELEFPFHLGLSRPRPLDNTRGDWGRVEKTTTETKESWRRRNTKDNWRKSDTRSKKGDRRSPAETYRT